MMKPPYQVDEETQELLEAALNCLVRLSDAQVSDEGIDGLLSIAEQLSEAFGIQQLDAEVHYNESGEEIIYKPRGGLFGNDEDEDDDDEE